MARTSSTAGKTAEKIVNANNEKAIIRFNKDACGIELVLPRERHLSPEEKEILRSLGFCWHKKNFFYYTKYTDEKLELVRLSFLGKEAIFPAKTANKVMSEIAQEAKARRESERAEKAKTASKRSTANDERLTALETALASQTAMMNKLIEALSAKTNA